MTGFFLRPDVGWVRSADGSACGGGWSAAGASTVPVNRASSLSPWLALAPDRTSSPGPPPPRAGSSAAAPPTGRSRLPACPPRVEAAEHALLQVHAERPASSISAVDRAGAPPLRAAATQSPRQPQVIPTWSRLWFGLGRQIGQIGQMGQEGVGPHVTGSLALAVLDDWDDSPARDQAGESRASPSRHFATATAHRPRRP